MLRMLIHRNKHVFHGSILVVIISCVVFWGYIVFAADERQLEGISLSVMVSEGHRQMSPLWEERLPEFERETGIKVEFIPTPYTEIMSRALQDFTFGAGTIDVVEYSDDMFISIADFLAPLDNYINKEGINKEEWQSRWWPTLTKHIYWRDKVVGVPYYNGTRCLGYRKSLFEDPNEQKAFKARYGYDLKPPRTIDELRDIAEFFTRDTDEDGRVDFYGLLAPGMWNPGTNVFEEFIYNHGLDYIDENYYCMWGERYPENQEILEKLAEFWQNMFCKWKFCQPGAVSMGNDEVIKMYLEGKGAMIIAELYFGWPTFTSEEVVKRIGETGTVRVPSNVENPECTGWVSAWAFGISSLADDKTKEAAWEFIKWATSEENLKFTLKKADSVFIPGEIELTKWAIEEGLIPNGVMEALEKIKFHPFTVYTMQARNILRKYTEQLIIEEISPEEYVKKTATEIDKLFESLRD